MPPASSAGGEGQVQAERKLLRCERVELRPSPAPPRSCAAAGCSSPHAGGAEPHASEPLSDRVSALTASHDDPDAVWLHFVAPARTPDGYGVLRDGVPIATLAAEELDYRAPNAVLGRERPGASSRSAQRAHAARPRRWRNAHLSSDAGRPRDLLGNNDAGQAPIGPSLAEYTSIVANGNTTCGIRRDRRAVCRGAGFYAQDGQPLVTP
jgi:hypothetical protein